MRTSRVAQDVIVPSLEVVRDLVAKIHAMPAAADEAAAPRPGQTPQRRPNLIPIYGQIPVDLITPSAAYLKVSAHRRSDHSFLYESAAGERVGRYSFVAAGPRKVVVSGPGYGEAADPLPSLERELAEHVVAEVPGMKLPPLHGGAVGYVG